MSFPQLATRFLAIVSGEPIRRLEHGNQLDIPTHRRAARVLDEVRERTGGRLFCNERPISSLDDVCNAIKYQWEYKGCRYVITDYLQLAEVLGLSDRLETITRVSGELRKTAKELNIISIGLSQFNRETSKDYENPPTVQGLMGGSPLENDSDQVLMIDHSRYEKNEYSNSATQHLILGKNRHGSSEEFVARWDYTTLRIAEESGSPEAPASTGADSRWEPGADAVDEVFEAEVRA